MKDSRSPADHGGDGGRHARNVHRKIGLGQVHHIHHPLGDVDRLIAHAFEVGIDLGDGEDEAQVHGHGLLHGQKVERHLVDFALGDVDLGFAFEHHAAASQVAVDVGLAGAVHCLLGQSAHAEQTCPEFVHSLHEIGCAHYPNLPVM